MDAAAPLIRAARWLHVTGITPALSASAQAGHARALDVARDANVAISFDVNLRRLLWSDEAAAEVLRPLVRRATAVMGSADELAVVAGTPDDGLGLEAARRLVDEGVGTVIVKRGAAGAALVDARGGAVEAAALPVASVVDPVGAGDACCAGYLAACLDDLEPATALHWAVACGAAAVTVEGDMDGLPDRETLERLLGAAGPDVLR